MGHISGSPQKYQKDGRIIFIKQVVEGLRGYVPGVYMLDPFLVAQVRVTSKSGMVSVTIA